MSGTCIHPGCKQPQYVKQFCKAHYFRQYRKQKMEQSPTKPQYGDAVQISGTKLPSAVATFMEGVCRLQDISMFELVRRILLAWFERVANQPGVYTTFLDGLQIPDSLIPEAPMTQISGREAEMAAMLRRLIDAGTSGGVVAWNQAAHEAEGFLETLSDKPIRKPAR